MTSKIDDHRQRNPAVLRCCEAYIKAYDAHAGEDEGFALDEARTAYRQAMPPLFGIRNVRNFLFCAIHGLEIGAIDAADFSRYVVQVAYSARSIRISEALKKEIARSKAIKGGKNAAQEPFPAPVQTGLTCSPANN